VANTLPINTTQLLLKLVGKLDSRRKAQFAMLIGLTLVSSVTEVISLGAILPFIGILTQPDVVFEEPRLAPVITWLEIDTPAELVMPLTLGFALAALIAGMFRLLLLWVSIRLGNATGADLGIEIFRRTLYQPYHVHISRNSSEIISAITQKVATATSVLVSMVTLITSSILFVAIFSTLIIIDPVVALIAMASFSIGYGLIAWVTRRRLLKNGEDIAREQTNVIKALQEGLGAIRDVLLDATQRVYTGIYSHSVLRLQRASSENAFFNQAPRFAMESLGIILIASFALALSYRPGGVGGALPVLAMLALGAQRLLPLMQQLYGNWTVLNGSKSSLLDVIELLEQPAQNQDACIDKTAMSLQSELEFKQVSFRYAGNKPIVLDAINLKIRKGERIGIIGPTGCGKSTLMDLVMALLVPTSGSVSVDGKALNTESVIAWQANIAHVPQNIFLADSSIAENIAFGVPRDAIDMDRVKLCATQAKLSDFIEQEDAQYDTIVGERGVRLSGGQRQRIGIARALYKKVSVLVLDEATSALDDSTESAVMKSIENLSSELTIIIIAHRISTLAKCNRIIELREGHIVKETSYSELINAGAANS
jgi:ABC-type bacteriocin/lantibiotic exporter with double-glycine peptidase domain